MSVYTPFRCINVNIYRCKVKVQADRNQQVPLVKRIESLSLRGVADDKIGYWFGCWKMEGKEEMPFRQKARPTDWWAPHWLSGQEKRWGNPIRLKLEMISQCTAVKSFCGIWLNEPHFTPRCLVHFQIALSLTSQSITPNFQQSVYGLSLLSPYQFSAQF